MTAAASAASPADAVEVVDGAEWRRPGPTPAQRRNDVLLALVLFGGTLGSAALYRAAGVADGAPYWHSAIWAATMSLPLAWRRVAPEIVAITASVAFFVGAMAEIGELLFSNITLFIAIYTLGAWGRNRRVALLVRAGIVLGMFVWLIWGLVVAANAPDHLPEMSREGGLVSPYVAYALINVVTNLLYFGGAWYFGDNAYRSARERVALEQRTEELAAERERTREQAVAIERLRIARELHDVVAHHVSVIGVQAGAARRVLARDPEAATASLTAIEHSAREAVAELHGLLGTLRQGDGDAADGGTDAPAEAVPHGLDDLPDLVAESSASGVPTTLGVIGTPRETSGVVGITAYRLVQEALTNVRKHAGAGATADVRVRWADEELELEVSDTGTARSAATRPGGLGHAGMRERVSAVGGELELGARHRGGYLVRATLPLRRAGAIS